VLKTSGQEFIKRELPQSCPWMSIVTKRSLLEMGWWDAKQKSPISLSKQRL
jgi:hypothetical protein